MSVVFTPQRRKLSADQFERMGQTGILGPDARVELIEGELIEMAPIGSRHAAAVDFLSMHFARLVGDAALVRTQNPLRLADDSEPQPDLMLLRPRADRYRSAHPRPADVLLLIEVAETTLVFDRETKLPLYAKHGVPEVWILDLDARRLEIHREPGEGGYRRKLERGEAESIAPMALPAAALQVGAVFA
ncbi:MAG TPA: Uma2 family endonuclease [Burkholderiales bacterium]|nr:Uma2 family endonuclease [Burkholderiales bacterium]